MKLLTHQQRPDVQAAIARAKAQGDRLASFGVGAGCTPPPRQTLPPTGGPGGPGGTTCPLPPNMDGCVRPGRTCDVNRIGTTIVVQGGSVFKMKILPTKVPWFQPLGVRATITDNGSTDLSHRVMFTAVTINGIQQESINNLQPVAPAAPVAPATQGGNIDGWWSDDWIDPDGFAVPIGWGWVSIEANLQVLEITGIALGTPVNSNLLVSVSIYGNPSMTKDGSTHKTVYG